MVYRGVPSKACNKCRVRRTRCNQQAPACGQCLRTGRSCEYRDLLSVIFKNQSQTQTTSARNIKGHLTAESNENSNISGSLNQRAGLIPGRTHQPLSPIISLDLTTDDQALSHVFYHYVFKDTQISSTRGYFDYLPDLIRTSSPSRYPYLHEATIALGLVGIANQDTSGRAMQRALVKYNKAVGQISQLLGDINEAKKNQLLAAVTILGFVESSASSLPRSLESWMQHIVGSFSLLQLRGPEMLQTFVGRRLFLHVRTQYVRCCIQRRIPLPPEVDESHFTNPSDSNVNAIDPATKSLLAALRDFCALRAATTNPENVKDHFEVVKSCRAVDVLLEEWVNNTPRGYGYTCVDVPFPCDDVYQQSYHIYGDTFIAQLWNNYRTTRLLVHQLLIEHLNILICLNLGDNTHYHSQIAASQRMLYRLSLEICASAPYHFDFHLPVQDRRPKILGGKLLMWPLYSTTVAGKVDSEMLLWIVGRLRKIAREMGIGHAAALAEISVRRCQMVWKEGIPWSGELQRPNASDAEGVEGSTVHGEDDDDKWETFLSPVVVNE